MPVWLRNLLIGLIIFTIGLILGILFQFVVCALALGVAVFQLWYRRGSWLWTWPCLLAVALYVLGVYLALRHELAWFLYFGAWIFVVVALVGEGSRAVRSTFGASTS
jgi:small basic protein